MRVAKRSNQTTHITVNLDNDKDNRTIKGLPTKEILIAEIFLSKQQQAIDKTSTNDKHFSTHDRAISLNTINFDRNSQKK